jgi:hypothetical protein
MNAPAATPLQSLQNPAPREANLPAVKAGFFDLQSFELIQRVSKAFSSSNLVPQQYQNNLPNCMIAMDMAQRIGANPLMVMQNLYIVHGTPGWSSKFLIATINACGRYSSLRYEWKGEPGKEDYGCRAWAIEKETGERLDGIWVTWKMVNAEGWSAKNGSKWKTMPDQMFVYRAAAFWQRAYAPELGMGLQTTEELHDVIDARPDGNGGFTVDVDALRGAAGDKSAPNIHMGTGEVVDGHLAPQGGDAGSAGTDAGPGGNGPTFEDAIAAINKGDYDGARSLSSGFSDGQKAQLETAITNHQNAGGQAGTTTSARRPRGSSSVE